MVSEEQVSAYSAFQKLRLCNLAKVSWLLKRQSRDSDPFLQLHIALGKQDTPIGKVK